MGHHVVLLGDSIFDNGAYVGTTLAAVDGAVASKVTRQLGRLPADTTHLVVSAGGNDALGAIGVLARPGRRRRWWPSWPIPRSGSPPATMPCWTRC